MMQVDPFPLAQKGLAMKAAYFFAVTGSAVSLAGLLYTFNSVWFLLFVIFFLVLSATREVSMV